MPVFESMDDQGDVPFNVRGHTATSVPASFLDNLSNESEIGKIFVYGGCTLPRSTRCSSDLYVADLDRLPANTVNSFVSLHMRILIYKLNSI